MRGRATWLAPSAGALWALGIVGCVVGGLIDPAAFQRVWLCSFVFWLGLPLAGVTLVLVHDLSGGDWMETARPILDAAIATMPVASLAGIPSFVGLSSLYVWAHPDANLVNAFYLNVTGFFVRYAAYVIVWNLLAAFALWGPRQGKLPIAPAFSWISGIGLVVLAFSAAFASIDWILSLESTFWSSAFTYLQPASWFNTGMAIVLFAAALYGSPAPGRRDHMADLARILLATTIFWAYIEFIQLLVIWEENLKTEIPWYLTRLQSDWHFAAYVSAGFGFFVPFFVLLWTPSKRSRRVVATICGLIVISRVADVWLLIMPEFKQGTPFGLNIAALLALGGAMVLLFLLGLRYPHRLAPTAVMVWRADHG
ncbi:MAG: hypothetical protein JO084_06935 [Bradyrhizobiaceae bacterium]|nr:hypothetical protein [Hyphomicrobiales bacterium]MBV9427438.1 hypothetical protein [Bradyrhizobiaceae bacterium]